MIIWNFLKLSPIFMAMWKTMPGRVKQVPQDSTEWDRTDTGHSTDKTSTGVISILTLVLNPLVISYKKYIYWELFMRFIRVWLMSSIIFQINYKIWALFILFGRVWITDHGYILFKLISTVIFYIITYTYRNLFQT